MKNSLVDIMRIAAILVASASLCCAKTALAANPPLPPLNSVSSTNGELKLDLVNKNIDTMINNHHVQGLRTYNGVFLGPTLRVHPGDTMKIRYINRLQADTNHPSAGHHGSAVNNVNLHTHGLNVSPEGFSDNVYLDVRPGEWAPIEIHIPANHPTGLFWYHPHRHGGVSTQLGSGMTGNIIITGKGDLDEIPEIAATRSNIVEMIFNEIPLFPLPETADPTTGNHYQVAEGGTLAAAAAGVASEDFLKANPGLVIYTVNGVPVYEKENQPDAVATLPPTPEITMRPGEVRRFQLTHAGLDQFLNLELLETDTGKLAPLHLLSYDAITLPSLNSSTNAILLGPGNRAEFLVKAGLAASTYMLRSTTNTVQVGAQPDIPLLKISVAGTPVDMNLPQTLNPPVSRLPDIQDNEIIRYRHVSFDVDLTQTGGLAFLVDGKEFDPFSTAFTVLMDTAEEWVISSGGNREFLRWGHPFHIHVNWFQVVKINGQPVPPRWQDTVVVPHGGSVTIRHRFQQYSGRFVIHCHILPHEDEGMMAGVEVVDPKNLNSLQTWRLNHLYSFENYNRSADSKTNSKGIPHLIQYALGDGNLPVSKPVQLDGKNYIGFQFPWQLQPEGLPNVANYFLAESTDLVKWSRIPSTDVVPPVDNNGVRSVFLRDNTPIGSTPDPRFVMVGVQTEPAPLPITPDLPE